ncbi:hypothetical protein H2248_001617 [Termitomyces sp. 'cryptogamus']|nr:hypothetical protein H2248_001617 [Termitomyces sp. 'cryptogamus']
MNGYLAQIDKATADMAAVDGVPPIPPKTMIRGVKPLERGAYLFELDSVESAARFRSYA